jgi:flagellar hook-basal body complex protein FliE
MDIKGNALYSQMQNMAIEAGSVSNASKLPAVNNNSGQAFGDLLKDAINTVNGLQMDSKEKSTNFELGDRSVSLAQVMIAKEKSGIAFEATVQVRNKLVEAYKEIMSMPV